MRARLSDATARGEYERAGGQDAAGYCAQVEARAILRDNETVNGCIGFSQFNGRLAAIELPELSGGFGYHVREARAAMVNALRAFGDSPDVAAYLAELQVRQ